MNRSLSSIGTALGLIAFFLPATHFLLAGEQRLSLQKYARAALSGGVDAGAANSLEAVLAKTFKKETKLVGSDENEDDGFGTSVSLSGQRALVGAYDEHTGGAAYIFVFDGTTWIQEARLTSPNTQKNGSFGASVSLEGPRAVIGAPSQSAAYFFHYNGTSWRKLAKFYSADTTNLFGTSVSLSGRKALVGTVGTGVYVFVVDGSSWHEEAKLTSGLMDDNFGHDVSLSSDRALIGASSDRDKRNRERGAAYIFAFDGTTWNQEAKLISPDAAQGNEFGNAVSISGNRALIGEIFGNHIRGTAWLFSFDGTDWTTGAPLVASDGTGFDLFGDSVSLLGNRALVGAPGDDPKGTRSGSAYLFIGPLKGSAEVRASLGATIASESYSARLLAR